MTRILLVDDVDVFLKLERTFLKRFGCDILMAKTGREALEKVREHRPDAILLDTMMPGMDGYDTCRRLKADPETREIPVIFVASDADQELINEVGGDDLVQKPIHREALLEALRRHVPIIERQAERVNVHLRVRLERGEEPPQNLYAKDLSQGGIFVKADPPLPLGERLGLRIRLPFPDGVQDVIMSGEVVRQVEDEADSHLIPGVGVRFVDISAPERARVGRFVRNHRAGTCRPEVATSPSL